MGSPTNENFIVDLIIVRIMAKKQYLREEGKDLHLPTLDDAAPLLLLRRLES